MIDIADLEANQSLNGSNCRVTLLAAVVLVVEALLPLRLLLVLFVLLVLLSLMLLRWVYFRPPRLVAMYSHVMPRFAQREHVGFSLGHFNLLYAQAWQLSRSLGPAGAVAP